MLRVRIPVGIINLKTLLLAAICVFLLSPVAQRAVGTVGFVAITGLFLILHINDILRCGRYEKNTMILIALYIGILLLYTFLGISDTGGGQTASVLFLLIYFIIVPVHRRLDRRQCIFILAVCLFAVLVTLVQNYALYIRMGLRFTQRWYHMSGILKVVNTQYNNAIMLLAGVLFSLFLLKKGTRVRFLFLTLAIICIAFNVVVTQRTIALLLTIVMLFLLLIVHGRITKRKIIGYFLLALLLAFVVMNYQLVLEWIADITNSDRMKSRIDTLSSLFATRDLEEVEEGSLTVRLRLIGVSISTFFGSLSNFVIGVGDKVNNTQVGNHSYFFDEFAKFGILGGTLSCAMVFRMLKTATRMSRIERNDPLKKYMLVIYATALLRALVGGLLSPYIGAVLFIITPLAFRVLKFDRDDLWEVPSQ